MRTVIQRVSSASVTSRTDDGTSRTAHLTAPGLAVLIGFETNDQPDIERWAADRIAGLRVFPDDHDKMNRSLTDIHGGALAVPNFTLAANPAKGRRPSFSTAMPPAQAERRYHTFLEELRRLLTTNPNHSEHNHPDPTAGDPELAHHNVAAGIFASHMTVQLTNDGPVTLVLEHPPD